MNKLIIGALLFAVILSPTGYADQSLSQGGTMQDQIITYMKECKSSDDEVELFQSFIKDAELDQEMICLNDLKKSKIPCIMLIQITKDCFSGDVATEHLIVIPSKYKKSLEAKEIQSLYLVSDQAWDSVKYQILPLTVSSQFYLDYNNTGEYAVIIVYYDGEKCFYIMSLWPWRVFNKSIKLLPKERENMLQIYFILIKLKESINNEIVNRILKSYFKAQLPGSVYFIYEKFKDTNEKQNYKLLEKLFPDEISVGK